MIRNSMVSLTALSLLIMVWACSDKTPAPSETPQAGYASLWESFDPKLQAAIETRFRQEARPQFWQLVKAKKAGIVVVDITDDKQPKVAGYNPDAEVYRKSGTWKSFHADSGVVVTDKYRYILVALAEHPDAGEGMVNLVQIVDDVVGSFH
jgi:hypothetical protein